MGEQNDLRLPTVRIHHFLAKLNRVEFLDFFSHEYEIQMSNETSLRRLNAEATPDNNTYKITRIVYDQNPFAYDGYFPYPSSKFPVVIAYVQANNQFVAKPPHNLVYLFDTDVVLSRSRFNIFDKPNWVCLQRLPTLFWGSNNCSQRLVQERHTLLRCECSELEPTTGVNDYNYRFKALDLNMPFELPKQTCLAILFGLCLWWFISVIWSIGADKKQASAQESIKPSMNVKLHKNNEIILYDISNQDEQPEANRSNNMNSQVLSMVKSQQTQIVSITSLD